MNEIGIIEFDYENNVICIYQEKEWHDYSTSELKDYLNDINVELQAYKDKEDKLRVELENFHTQFEIDETIPLHSLKSKKEILEIARQQIKNCLQILNEGDK